MLHIAWQTHRFIFRNDNWKGWKDPFMCNKKSKNQWHSSVHLKSIVIVTMQWMKVTIQDPFTKKLEFHLWNLLSTFYVILSNVNAYRMSSEAQSWKSFGNSCLQVGQDVCPASRVYFMHVKQNMWWHGKSTGSSGSLMHTLQWTPNLKGIILKLSN